MRADVVVLGGGVIGCLSALRLRDRGLDVVLVERGELGGEASGAAAGILGAQAEARRPGPLFDLALRSRALYPSLAEELRLRSGIDVGYRPSGALVLALDQDEAEALAMRATWQTAAGLAVERLESVELARLEPQLGAALAGLRFADDHQVEPRRLADALRVACERAGVRLRVAEARSIRHDGARVLGAELDRERIDSGALLIAAGSWSSLLSGSGLERDAVSPVRGQLLEIAAPSPPFAHVVYGDGGYLVPRADGRVVVGSTEERAGYHKEVTTAGLERLSARARRLCPALARYPVVRSWSGLRPSSADGLPYLGATALAGLYLATAHYRNGILLAPITAELIAGLLVGAPLPVDLAPFSPLRSQ